MNRPPLLIADADAIIALANIEDAHYTRTKILSQQLEASHAYVLYPTTALCEAVTLFQRRLGRPDLANVLVEQLHKGMFPLQSVDQEHLQQALTLFNPHGSKQNTLFDAIVAASARLHNADAIFSFDEWYRKQGFTLVEDFISAEKAA